MNTRQDVRPSPFAGQWYESHPQRLAAEVDGYLAAAQLPAIDGQIVALIAPHAGHRYSGPVAGYAFRAVQGMTFERVVIVSPKHRYIPDALVTSAYDAYATPLGVLDIDVAAREQVSRALESSLGVGLGMARADQEHAVEIELPFLQRALSGGFKILPVMLREQSPEVAQALAAALAGLAKEAPTLLVASTDLSHGYTHNEAQVYDARFLAHVEAFSPEGIYQADARGEGFACGLGAVAAILYAGRLLGAERVQLLNYATSAATSGDTGYVVGYAAAAVLKPQ